jgi:hypothetical protein
MSIPTPAELRAKLAKAGNKIEHPTKGKDARYGNVVYVEGGAVIVKKGGDYLVADGATHDESVWGLAHHLDLVSFGPDVKVRSVDRDEFVRLVTGG